MQIYYFLKNLITRVRITDLTQILIVKKEQISETFIKNFLVPILILVFSVQLFFKNLELKTLYVLVDLFLMDFTVSVKLAANNLQKLPHLDPIDNYENLYYFSINSNRVLFTEKLNYIFINRQVFIILENLKLKCFEIILIISNNFFTNNKTLSEEFLLIFFIITIVWLWLFYLYKMFTLYTVVVLLLFWISIAIITFLLFKQLVIFKSYDLFIHYSMFKINYSFLNKNVYIDSNYFLTSDNLRGLEKFTELTVPWMVDSEDSGWGGDFEIQEQVDLIREREHKLVTEDIELNNSPLLTDREKSDGSFNSRFLKIKQRFDFFIKILTEHTDINELLWKSWQIRKLLSVEAQNFYNLEGFIFNFFEFENFKKINPNNNILGNTQIIDTKEIFDDLFSDSDFFYTKPAQDYFLPKKNNVTNDYFNNSSGNIFDRKQIVYRNLINQNASVEKIYDVKYRKPDTVLDTNYIFERQLQNLRISEYNIKEKLFEYFDSRWQMYSKTFENKTIQKKKLIFLKTEELDYKLNNFKNIKNYGYLQNLKLPNYSINDIKLENLVNFWNSDNLERDDLDLRSYEYVYFKNSEKLIKNFNPNDNFILEAYSDLLLNNDLGLGTFTYQSDENTPWAYDSLEFFEIFKKIIKDSTLSLKLSSLPDVNQKKYYTNLTKFIEQNFKTYSNDVKKKLLIYYTKRYLEVWFDFEKICNNWDLLFKLIHCEFILENLKNLNEIITVLPIYIKLTNMFLNSNFLIAKDNWGELINNKKIEEKNNNHPPKLHFNYLLKSEDGLLWNYKKNNIILQNQKQNNWYLFKKLKNLNFEKINYYGSFQNKDNNAFLQIEKKIQNYSNGTFINTQTIMQKYYNTFYSSKSTNITNLFSLFSSKINTLSGIFSFTALKDIYFIKKISNIGHKFIESDDCHFNKKIYLFSYKIEELPKPELENVVVFKIKKKNFNYFDFLTNFFEEGLFSVLLNIENSKKVLRFWVKIKHIWTWQAIVNSYYLYFTDLVNSKFNYYFLKFSKKMGNFWINRSKFNYNYFEIKKLMKTFIKMYVYVSILDGYLFCAKGLVFLFNNSIYYLEKNKLSMFGNFFIKILENALKKLYCDYKWYICNLNIDKIKKLYLSRFKNILIYFYEKYILVFLDILTFLFLEKIKKIWKLKIFGEYSSIENHDNYWTLIFFSKTNWFLKKINQIYISYIWKIVCSIYSFYIGLKSIENEVFFFIEWLLDFITDLEKGKVSFCEIFNPFYVIANKLIHTLAFKPKNSSSSTIFINKKPILMYSKFLYRIFILTLFLEYRLTFVIPEYFISDYLKMYKIFTKNYNLFISSKNCCGIFNYLFLKNYNDFYIKNKSLFENWCDLIIKIQTIILEKTYIGVESFYLKYFKKNGITQKIILSQYYQNWSFLKFNLNLYAYGYSKINKKLVLDLDIFCVIYIKTLTNVINYIVKISINQNLQIGDWIQLRDEIMLEGLLKTIIFTPNFKEIKIREGKKQTDQIIPKWDFQIFLKIVTLLNRIYENVGNVEEGGGLFLEKKIKKFYLIFNNYKNNKINILKKISNFSFWKSKNIKMWKKISDNFNVKGYNCYIKKLKIKNYWHCWKYGNVYYFDNLSYGKIKKMLNANIIGSIKQTKKQNSLKYNGLALRSLDTLKQELSFDLLYFVKKLSIVNYFDFFYDDLILNFNKNLYQMRKKGARYHIHSMQFYTNFWKIIKENLKNNKINQFFMNRKFLVNLKVKNSTFNYNLIPFENKNKQILIFKLKKPKQIINIGIFNSLKFNSKITIIELFNYIKTWKLVKDLTIFEDRVRLLYKLQKDVYTYWYKDKLQVVFKSINNFKELKLILKLKLNFEIIDIRHTKNNKNFSKPKYIKNGLFLKLFDNTTLLKNKKQVNSNFKLLEFLNFSNFSEDFTINLTSFLGSLKNKKYFTKKNIDILTIGNINTYKKHIQTELPNFTNTSKKLPKIINSSRVPYVTVNYFINYLNYKNYKFNWKNSKFVNPGIIFNQNLSLKTWVDLWKNYEIDNYKNTNSYFKLEKVINYFDKNSNKSNLFDMTQKTQLIKKIAVSFLNVFILKLKYYIVIHQQKIQIWGLRINLEKFEWFFGFSKLDKYFLAIWQDNYRLLGVCNFEKSNQDLLLFLNFGEKYYNYGVFRKFLTILIFKKIKMLQLFDFLINNYQGKTITPFERQVFLLQLNQNFYLENFLIKNLNKFIDLVVLFRKIDHKFFFIYKLIYFWLQNTKFEVFNFFFENLWNSTLVEIIVFIYKNLEFFLNLFFSTVLHYTNKYLLSVNYLISDYPYLFHRGFNDNGLIKNKFYNYYIACVLNIKLIIFEIEQKKLLIAIENTLPKLSYFFEIVYEYYIYESENSENFQGKKEILSIVEIWEEVFDLSFECLILSWQSFLECRGQLIWLDICLFFDYIFEIFTSFDDEDEGNPFSKPITLTIEIIRKMLNGSPFSGYQFSDIELEFREIFIKYYDKAGADSKYATDYGLHAHNDAYFEDNELIEENSRNLELGHFNGIDQLDDTNTLDFLGWGFENNLGTDPSLEFSTINDILEIPKNIENYFNFDISNWYHEFFGLNSPNLGEIAPSFDITLPVKSLWLVGVLYYDPKKGGLLLIDSEALFRFFTILFLDKRTSFFSKVYQISDWELSGIKSHHFFLMKLKIIFILHDILQSIETVYINPFDFFEFFFFYIIFLINYYGIWFIFSMYFVFIIFGKATIYSERILRKYSRNGVSTSWLSAYLYNYIALRFIYPLITNSYLFLRMTIIIIVVLSLLYVFSEGLHIFSILRVFSIDHESVNNINAMYFLMERDPFVEKHVPNDEIWDEFRYDSTIDDEWSRIHYHREHAEIFGGTIREGAAPFELTGFSKKMNYIYNIHDNAHDTETTPSKKIKSVLDQIHNRIPDEGSFIPSFISDTELEREFFRESEMKNGEIEGSADWGLRSEERIRDKLEGYQLANYFNNSALLDRSRFGSNINILENNLYAALLINYYDPKWLWDETIILSERINKPLIFSHNKKELYNNYDDMPNNTRILREILAENRLISIIKRNRGIVQQNPILDFWDEDPYTDFGLEIASDFGSSIGSQSNQIDTWNVFLGDILTQKTKFSIKPNVGSGIYFNYLTNDDELPINFYESENLILENFIETIFNNPTPATFNTKMYSTDQKKQKRNYMYNLNKYTDAYETYFNRSGRFPTLENNAINNLFPQDDYLGTDDLDYFTGVFIDINNYKNENKSFLNTGGNLQNISLENLRRRDLFNKKMEGNDPVTLFYDEMAAEDVEKEIYRNLDNASGIAPRSFSSFFRNNEFMTKSNLNVKNAWTRSQPLDLISTLTEGDTGDQYEFLGDGYSEFNEANPKTKISYFSFRDNKIKFKKQNNWIQEKLIKKNIKNNLETKTPITLHQKQKRYNHDSWGGLLNKEYFKWLNLEIPNTDTNFFDNKKIKNDKNFMRNEKLIFKKNLINFTAKKIETTGERKQILLNALWNNYFIKKIKNKKLNISDNNIFFEKIKENFKKNIKFFELYENKKNKLNLKNSFEMESGDVGQIFKKIKNKENRLNMGENYFKIKHKISETFSKKIKNNKLNDIYRKKITDYILSKTNTVINKNNQKKYGRDLLTKLNIFFNDKWYLDHAARLGYDHFNWNTNDFDIWDTLGGLKKKGIPFKDMFFEKTRLSEYNRYGKNRGYWGKNTESQNLTDLRMHGLFKIDHFPSPIYQNDDDAFQEYIELWNPNFGKLKNNLEYLSKGNVMGIHEYEYNHLLTDDELEYWETESLDHYTSIHDEFEQRMVGEPFKKDILNIPWYPKTYEKYLEFGGNKKLKKLPKKIIKELELGSISVNASINWYKPLLKKKIILKKKSPWGWDSNSNYFWSGTQYYNFGLNGLNLNMLFKKKYYNLNSSSVSEFFNNSDFNFKQNQNIQNSLKKKYNNRSQKNQINFEILDKGAAKINDTYNKFSNYKKKNTQNSKIKVNKKPEPFDATTFDFGTEAELKESFGDNDFEYGKNIISLKQHALMSDYWEKNIPQQNRVITPMQSSEYFWYLYKKQKHNNSNYFFKKLNYNKTNISGTNNTITKNWEEKIKNPEIRYDNHLFTKFFDKDVKIDNECLEDLGDSWLSNRLLKTIGLNFSKNKYRLEDLIADEAHYKKLKKSKKTPNTKSKIRRGMLKIFKNIGYLTNTVKNVERVKFFHKRTPTKNIKKNKNNFLYHMGLFVDYDFFEKKKNQLFGKKNKKNLIDIKKITFKKKPVTFKHNVIFDKKINEIISHELARTALKEIYELPLADTKLQKSETGVVYNFDDDDENYVEVGLGTHSEFTGENITDNELLGNNNSKVNQDLIKNSLFFRQLNKHGYDSDDLVTDILQNYNTVSFVDQQNQENSEIFEIIKNKSLQIPNFEIFKYRNNNTRFDKKKEYLEDDFVDTDDILQNFEILNNFESNGIFWDESLDYTDSNSLDLGEGFLENLDNSDSIDFDDNDNEDDGIFENDSKIFDELDEREISGFILEDFEDSFEEDIDLVDDDDDDDDDDDFESDDDVFFNKIININLHEDVDYRSSGILKSFENEDTLLDVEAFEDIEDFESIDDVFLLFENENVFYNKNLNYNNKNKQLPTKWRNWANLNKNVWDKRKLKNKLGFVSENYLNLGKKINSNIRDTNSDSFAEYGLDENIIKNKMNVRGEGNLKKINKNLNYTASFILPKKNYKQIIENLNENNKKYYYKKYYEPNFQTEQIGLNVWKNKQNNYNFGGELPNSWGLDNVLKNSILNKNKNLIGITNSFNLKKNSVFLDKTKKIDYTFSDKKYTQNNYTDLGLGNVIRNQNFKLDNNTDDNTSNLTVSFKYGLSDEDKFLGSKKLNINKRFGYFKYNNTQKILENNIDGFFKNFDQNKNKADVDYISAVTYPVQVDFEKKIKKPSSGYFILNQKKEELQKHRFENINQNKTNISIDIGKNLDNIFKSAYSTINAKGEKIAGLSFKKYSASETIQPMPILRSLSVDSKLFSKINSLRLFGAGRLNESIYNPKLKHLLKNQINFYEIDDSEEDLDINEETYVLKLKKNDEEFDKNLKPSVLGFGQISEEIWKANQSENSKSFYRNIPINQFLKKNYLNLEIKLKNLMKKSKKKYSNLGISLQNTENLHRNYYQDNNVLEFFNKELDDFLEINPEVQDTDALEISTLTPIDIEFGKKQLEKKKITENLSNHHFLKKQIVLNNFGEFEEHFDNLDDDFFDYDDENSFEDADDGFWEKHTDYVNGDMLDIVDKEDWLFELYKEIVDVNTEKDQNWFWQTTEDGAANDDLVENFDMEELSQLEDLENLEHAKETLFVENGSLVSENLESSYNVNSDLLFFNDMSELDDLDELQESYINDLTIGDNFDNNFDEDYSDLEELDKFIQNQYDNFVIPNQMESRTYLEDLNFENLGLLTLNSLNKRDFSNFNSAITYLNQEDLKIKNNYYNPSLIKIDAFSLDSLSALEKINRAEIQDSLDFGLERNPWADTILDFELFEINKMLDDVVVDNNFNSNIEEKLENIDKFENYNLLNDLGNYFIKNQGLVLNQENIYEQLSPINTSILENGGEFLDIFFKNETKHLWNIKNQNKDSKLIKIKQRQNLENLTQIDIKLLLGAIKNKTIIKKNILNTEKTNLGIFLRKTNTTQNSGSERMKFKNLKKKYWYRLDILERFVSNLKKYIKYNSKTVINKNKNMNEKPLQVEFGDNSDKNIVSVYKIKENYITNNPPLDDIDFGSLENDFKNYNSNYENFKKLKQNIKNLKKNKTLENFWNYKKQSIFDNKTTTKYIIFDNIEQQQFYNIFGKHRDKKYTNVTDLNLNTDLGDILGFMNAKQPLLENFKGLHGAGILSGAVINKNIDALGFSTTNGVENERDFEAFEKIRSNMSKFQTYNNANNYLPVDLISNFLHKLPNFGTYSYIGEGLKKINNYGIDLISKNNQDLFTKKLKQKRGVRSVNKLNVHNYFKKLPAIDDFSIYHKPLDRPGLEFRNKFSKIQIDPFRTFYSKNTLINRGEVYGLGTSVYKNNLASRRIYGLALRTFGPDIRTNSITKGYGRFDDVFEINTNTDDMTVEMRGLGYPILSEQNTYNTDYPAGPVSGSESSIYESKLVDYLWDLDALEEDEPETIITWEPGNENSGYGLNYDVFELIASIFAERSSNEADVYPIKANYERYVGIWNQKSILEDREHIDTENEDYLEAIENGEDFTIKEVEDSLSDLKLTEDRYWDWQFLYDTEFGRTKKNLENKVTRKLYFNKSKNIGPLGYEEGDSLHDNRLLNRGWFPEKEVFSWGSRTHSGVGSDASTLELLADYKATFNFEIEDYTNKYKYESFKDLNWAGNKNNKLFDTIDDIVEGFGFEENIPFTPELAEKIWHKEEYVNRYVYDDFDFGWMEKDEYPEDDEPDDYSIYTDPDGFYYYNDRLFNTLGFANFVASTTSWEKSKYLANLDSLAIPGIATALADNELHDGLLSDFSNFIQEKLPQDPINIFKQQNLPLVTSGILRSEDYFDSKIPEFSEFVNESGNDQFEAFKERRESTFRELSDRDSSFYSLETYKPKDAFSFTPNNGTFQRFEQEWVINGEGWLGNTGFNLSPLSQTNLPITYISTQNNIFTQPKGIHSFETSDDLDLEGGLDSPYYSLSDFQKNRIIRGRDNDVSNFPIKFTWNNISQHIPDWYNAFWKHRLNFGEAEFQTLGKSWNFETSKQMGGIGIPTGIDIPFSNIIGENPDFINYSNNAINERTLWWRAIDSGVMSQKNKENLAFGILSSGGENYRDFLLSYDFKLFGKNWLNPQETKIPLKSFNFYGDSQINTFLSNSENEPKSSSGGVKNLDGDNFFSDFTYGIFKDSQLNGDVNTIFFAQQLRDYLYKLFEIGLKYTNSVFDFLKSKITRIFTYLINILIYKIENFNFILKLIFINDKLYRMFTIFMFEFLYFSLLPLMFIIKKIFNIFLLINFYLLNFEIIFTNNIGFLAKSGIIFEIFYDFFYIFWKIKYKLLYLENYYSYLMVLVNNIMFILLVLIIILCF